MYLEEPASKAGTRYKSEGEVLVIVSQSVKYDKFKLLSVTLERSGFWVRVEEVRKSCNISRADFRVVIKADLEFFDSGAPTGADPEVVEHLITLLHRQGYDLVVVADSLGSADLWLENRDVAVLADLVGYRYVTEDGRPYDIVNMSEDVIDGGFPDGGALTRSKLGRSWAEAHFRISIAKNKTHEEHFFSLGLQNLLGVLPLRDKEYHYYHRLDPGDVCIELLRQTPVHFSLIEALVSNHGSDGIQSMNPLSTNTLIASEDLLLADWAAALKMGIDPYASPLNAKALAAIGLPRRYRIVGNLIPYPGWNNVPLVLSDSVRKRNRSISVRQIVRPWFQSVNRDLFPFKNSVDDRVNHFIVNFLSKTDQHPMVLTATVGLNYLLAGFHNLMEGYGIIYDKDRVWRKQTPLGLDLKRYSLCDYEAIVDYMEPLAQVAAQTPPDRNGLRWRYIDKSVLFEFSRTLPIEFDEFVSHVEISKAVHMMNDNIGGASEPVSVDSQGRITHQAERNIYLPQPNWMVIFGGKVIDVGKLEFVRYEENRRQIFWRTVTSANESATFDDGIVTFARDDVGKTAITIVARQQFALPSIWQAINMDFIPQVKDTLVSDAYTTFFSRTMANYEAVYEGRDVGTGRAWILNYGEPDVDEEKMPLEQLVEVFVKFLGIIEPLIIKEDQAGRNAYFGGVKDSLSTFFKGLFDAINKDMRMMSLVQKEDT